MPAQGALVDHDNITDIATYRSLNGAEVGDLFMSLIHTCQLCGANSFDYLIELWRHDREPGACPAEWTPWNYRDTFARTAAA
jgi:transposase